MSRIVQELAQTARPDQSVVLVADDEVVVRDFARIVLEAEGYFVLTAGDGEQALSISRQYVGTIHALLSDVDMPDLDGLELRRQLLMERPEIRVLLMSGRSQNPGADIPFLTKPFGPTELKQRIRKLLVRAATV
jgi:two-component system cell cycle sensor histidine kinase/response regulator CckA